MAWGSSPICRLLTALVLTSDAIPSYAAPPTLTYLFPAGGMRGKNLEVIAGGTFETWPPRIWASDPGLQIQPSSTKGKLTVTIPTETRPGVHYIRFYNEHGSSSLRPFIISTLPEVLENEPNDSPTKPQPVVADVIVNGRLDKTADVDVFAIRLEQGQTLVASLEANRTLKSPMDAVLQILSPEGFVEAENHDHCGLDPLVTHKASKSGEYRVRLFAFPAVPNSAIQLSSGETYIYRLTLTVSGFLDFTTPLVASRQESTRLKLHGWNLPRELQSVSVGPGGEPAWVADPQLGNAVALRRESLPVIDGVNDTSIFQSLLVPPFALTGRIASPGSAVSMRIPVKRAQPLPIEVDNLQTQGLPLTPLLRVLDESGSVLSRVEPARPGEGVKTIIKPPGDGVLTVEVRDLFGEGGPRHVFLLRAGAVPDFTITCPNDRLYLAPGKPLDVKLAVARLGGHRADISMRAQTLPSGIRMEVLPPADKPDPSSVTVRFFAEQATMGGPLLLVGQSRDDPPIERVALASDPDLGELTPHLWIVATDAAKPPPPPKKKR